MASPLPTAKQSVNLSSPGVRGSRIRRDPPPKVKEGPPIDPAEVDRRAVMLGIAGITLVLALILVGIASYNGWSPRSYIAHL